jgi:hypothetical protein
VVVADFTAIDVMWICLSVFLVLVALAGAFLLVRLASTARRLTSLLTGVEQEAVPLIHNANGTVERVNRQLDKADIMTDSAVSAVVAVDKTVRTVTGAVAWPVRKLSGLAAGVKHGAASLQAERDPRRAYDVAREAAARRERDITEELTSDPRRPGPST